MKRLIVTMLFATIFTSLASARQMEWYAPVTHVTPDLTPTFCPSLEPKCGELLAHPADFEVFLIKDNKIPGGSRELVWRIGRLSGEYPHEIVYGVTPTGWVEMLKPEPLQLDQMYRIGNTIVIFKKRGDRVAPVLSTVEIELERARERDEGGAGEAPGANN